MNKDEILLHVNDIFKDVLDMDELVVTETTAAADIDEWDSLTHIQLIVAIEKKFGMKFTSMEISNWKNVGEMVANIHKKTESSVSPVVKETIKTEAQPKTQTSINDETLPSYKRNFINTFPNIKHGVNCFVSEGATLTNVEMGNQVWINKHATVFSSHDKVVIGSNCYIGPYVWIEGHAGIEMGDSVHIAGPGTSLYTHSGMKMALNGEHLGNPGYKPDIKSLYYRVPIRIGNNVWIGPGCSISPGTVIQDNVVVMPNTYVKSGIIESYSVVSGNGEVEKNSDFVRSLLVQKK